MPLGEVPGRYSPAAAAESAAQVVERERDRPEGGLRSAVGEPGDDDQHGPDRRPDRKAEDAAQHGAVASRGEDEEDDVEQAHGEVGDAEEDTVVPEGVRHRKGDDEQRSHRAEDRQPHGALVRVDIVRQPGVAGPGPPERAEHEQSPPDAGPGRVAREHRRHLRDREHEDEVEEELERGDTLLAFGAHGKILMGRPASGSPPSVVTSHVSCM